MSNIDWSKAPEGTTHYGPPTEKYFGNWFQAHLCGWSIFYENRWLNVGEIQGERFDSLVPRPTQWGSYTTAEAAPAKWTGEDGSPPPVGTACEVQHETWAKHIWEKRTILWAGKTTVVTLDTGGEERNGFIRKLTFRPIRTAEQLAAEQREKDAQSLFEVIHPDGKWHKADGLYKERFRIAIDEGYRKVQP